MDLEIVVCLDYWLMSIVVVDKKWSLVLHYTLMELMTLFLQYFSLLHFHHLRPLAVLYMKIQQHRGVSGVDCVLICIVSVMLHHAIVPV